MLIGYGRVSTDDQSTDVQAEQLKALGCEKVYLENASGKSSDRKQLKAAIDFARDGDVLVATKTDRIARNTIDALRIADELAAKGVGLKLLDLGDVDINSDVGRLIYTTISAFAEMERKRIVARCNEGRDKARAEGKHLGRKDDLELHKKIKAMGKKWITKGSYSKGVRLQPYNRS